MKKKIPNEFLENLREIQEGVYHLSLKVDEILDQYKIPVDLEEIKTFLQQNPKIQLSTSWLQRRYKIGYAEATEIMDKLKA